MEQVRHPNIEATCRVAARCRALLAAAPDAVLAVDAEGRIIEASEQVGVLFGYRLEELLGSAVEVLLPERVRATHLRHQAEYAASPRRRPMGSRLELLGRRKDGVEFPVEVSLSPVETHDGPLVLAAVRDVSEHTRLMRSQVILAEASQAFAEAGLELQAALEAVVRRVAESVGDVCVLALASEEGGELRPVAFHHSDSTAAEAVRTVLSASVHRPGEGLHGQVVRTGEALLLAEVDPELARARVTPQSLPYLEQVGIHGVLIVPIRARGRVIGTLGVTRDSPGRPYTEPDRHLLQELADRAGLAIANARLYEEAREATRTRDDVLALVAHDIRNPLTAISGYAQMLQLQLARIEDPKGPELRAAAERICRSVEVTRALVQDLSDVTRLQAGQLLELQRGPTDLASLAQQAAEDAQAVTGRHTLSVEVAADRLVGHWDAVRLRRVLDNLLDNAVKFSPAGGSIVLRLDREGDAARTLARLQVEDQGIGITSRDLPRLFRRYFRAGNAAEVAKGTGLGLAGAKQIVEQHGGTIAVSSIEGRGTTVTLRLPMIESAPPDSTAWSR